MEVVEGEGERRERRLAEEKGEEEREEAGISPVGREELLFEVRRFW